VKLVSGINVQGGVEWRGYGVAGTPALVLVSSYCDGLTAMHEFGHTAGLEHRGLVDPQTGKAANPGDFNDSTAIMHNEHAGGKEINRFERDHFNSWNPPLWNQ
jgi:hypothetical protein